MEIRNQKPQNPVTSDKCQVTSKMFARLSSLVACLLLLVLSLVTRHSSLLASQACTGGPPDYCARQDWVPAQGDATGVAPAELSGITGANRMTVGPDFGERIVRLTDANAEGSPLNHEAMVGFSGDSGGSDESEPISLNDHFFFVLDNSGNILLYSFDPVNMVANRLYQAAYPSTNGLILADGGHGLIWSGAQDDVLYEYGIPSTDLEIWHWTFSSLTTPPGSSTLDKDLTADTNCNVLPTSGGSLWYSALTTDATSNNFAMATGTAGQGSATTALVWQKSTNKCAWLNISNGQYGGNLGSSGTISGFTTGGIHNLRFFGNGAWLRIDYNTNDIGIWQVGTGNYYFCAGNGGPCGGGHLANGYNAMITGIGANLSPFTPKHYAVHAVATPNTYNLISVNVPGDPVQPYSYDSHVSWNQDNASDNFPTTYSGDGEGDNPYAWTDEIAAMSANFSQMAWRFARTWALKYSYYFVPNHAIGQVSRDGKFFMIGTDWGGQFGSTGSGQISSWTRSGNTVTVTATGDFCSVDSIYSGDSFIIEGAALGTGGTSINGTWAMTIPTIAAPASTPTLSTSTTGGFIPASTVVTVGVAYTTGGLGWGCHTTIAPVAQITTGSGTNTNTVTVQSPPTETNAAGYGAYACLGSVCTPVLQHDTAIGTATTVGDVNNVYSYQGLYVEGYASGGSGGDWMNHGPAPTKNGGNLNTMTFTQTAANDSSSTAQGYILDNDCSPFSLTEGCRYDAVMIEMK